MKFSKTELSLLKSRSHRRKASEHSPQLRNTASKLDDDLAKTRHLSRDRRQDFDSGFDLCNLMEDSFSNPEDSVPPGNKISVGASLASSDLTETSKSNHDDHRKHVRSSVYKQTGMGPNSVESFASIDGAGVSIDSDDTGVALSATSGKLYQVIS